MEKMRKTIKALSVLLAGAVLFTSCASTTMIQSDPKGAKVYIDDELVGETPYQHRDTKIVGSHTPIRLEKDGYETFNTSIQRNEKADVGAIIGGVFFLVPFFWTMKYKPTHNYEMTPLSDTQSNIRLESDKLNSKSMGDRLRELKKLLNEGIITQEEYEKQKKKILEEG